MRRRPAVAAAAAAAADAAEGQAQTVLLVACVAMAMAAVHRVAFSVLALPIQAQLGLTLPQMGMLQSALLCGYLLGQVPCGMLADRLGGAPLAAAGLLLWSSVCLLFNLAPSSSNPFVALLAVRAALGLAQSCIMPAVGNLAARWFPSASRSRWTSAVYSAYSVGTVAGLALTPLLAEHASWSKIYALLGLAGMAAAVAGGLALPREGHAALQPWPAAVPAAGRSCGGMGRAGSGVGREALVHLLMLCFVHSVISFSFFIQQAWMPTFLASSGFTHLSSIGVLSALPWLATSAVSLLAGGVADRLQAQHRWSALRVRRVMQALAAGGTALSLLPLALPGLRLPPLATASVLVVSVGFQGLCYSGFHAYVAEVAPQEVGLVLSITNTCGTLVGIAGTLATGWLAASPLGYSAVFAATALLQALCLVAWLAGAHGRPLRLHMP